MSTVEQHLALAKRVRQHIPDEMRAIDLEAVAHGEPFEIYGLSSTFPGFLTVTFSVDVISFSGYTLSAQFAKSSLKSANVPSMRVMPHVINWGSRFWMADEVSLEDYLGGITKFNMGLSEKGLRVAYVWCDVVRLLHGPLEGETTATCS